MKTCAFFINVEDTLKTDAKTADKILMRMHWHRIVLDEGHNIRNQYVKINEAFSFSFQAHRKLACLHGFTSQSQVDPDWHADSQYHQRPLQPTLVRTGLARGGMNVSLVKC